MLQIYYTLHKINTDPQDETFMVLYDFRNTLSD